MRGRVTQRAMSKPKRPWRMLAISLVLSLLFGLAGMGEPLENVLRVARNKTSSVDASGDIVVATIDDASQAALGTWPWPRSLQARIIDRLSDAGASKIVVDLTVQFKSNQQGDREFAAAIKRSRKVVLPIHLRAATATESSPSAAHASMVSPFSRADHHSDNSEEVWRLPYAQRDGIIP